MRDNNPPVRRGREGLAKTPPPQIVCDKCGRKDVPAVMRTLIDHPFAKVWTFCTGCDPVLRVAFEGSVKYRDALGRLADDPEE